ncbi:Cyclin-dependent kinase 11B [Fusarium oxysporum f. sp. albedinis]|nr:Cyclin-dependent kinase 11B [Fusarium oxysporum f. sp. albedinis]
MMVPLSLFGKECHAARGVSDVVGSQRIKQTANASATGTSSIFLVLTYTVAGTISESLLDLFLRLFLLEIVHLHLPLPSSSSFPSSFLLPPYIPFAPGWCCLVLCRAALHRL